MDTDTYLRLSDNARQAYNNVNTEWGKNYWQTVLAALARRHGKLN
jgi:hypothetical protein